ncbi:MAG: rod shape-determining protein MreC [Elusimicrobiota bacterium]|nr:rod shape-determining protein MreC [Elusimicrobiota bacterium]
MQQRESRTAHYVLAALSTVALVLLSLPLSSPVRSFKAAASYVLDPVAWNGEKGVQRLAGAPERVGRLLTADMENQRLLVELKRLEWLKTTVESLSQENERLRRSLGLRPPAGRSPVWAHVLERDPLHWYRSVTLDAGSAQGVSLNDPVLGPADGRLVAVGRVVEVRPDTSIVLLLTDELSAAAAYLSSGTLEGLVQGQDGPRLRMNYLNAEAVIAVGDAAYTSPTSATFPPDILVGRVARVYPRDPFLTFQSVELAPALDASSLQELMILRSRPGAAPAADAPEPVVPEMPAPPPPPVEAKPKRRRPVEPAPAPAPAPPPSSPEDPQ